MKYVLLNTINDSNNLGQILSTYALYKVIEELGDYYVMYNDKKMEHTKVLEYIEAFCCKLSESHAYSSEEEGIDQLDAVVTGTTRRWMYSDQETVDDYLGEWFNNSIKKIVYAPSFGNKCEFPLGPKNAVYFGMQKLEGIAVADRNTLEILNLEFKVAAEKVCNPILLLDKYPYLDADGVEGLFIFCVFEKRDSQKQRVAEMTEEILKYRVVDFSKDVLAGGAKFVDEYLRAVEKSSFIITDSMTISHLAIVYKKPFIFITSKQENDRYECLSTLQKLGLMERVIYIEDDVREKRYLCRKPIRYGLVDGILREFQIQSIQWLKEKLV